MAGEEDLCGFVTSLWTGPRSPIDGLEDTRVSGISISTHRFARTTTLHLASGLLRNLLLHLFMTRGVGQEIL